MVASVPRSNAVSRTSSSSSIDCAFNAAEQRRTRKRITAAQLAQLEELYYRSSHPTRDQRDTLAKRIQMETKSVTIWFQNKRQTDRKVALHNATNSRNAVAHRGASNNPNNPNITITTPTSPAPPPEASIPQEGPRLPTERLPRRPSVTRSNPLKRIPSIAPSNASSSSMSSTSRARPSLDRVAARSEIRFTDRAPTSRSTSCTMSIDMDVDSIKPSSLVSALSGNNLPLQNLGSTITRSDGSVSVPPASPPPSTDLPLWINMLSSPITPSSPPSAEFVAYTRARKTRTLDWACAAARLAKDVASLREAAATLRGPTSLSSLGPPVSISRTDVEALEREYEEATAMTEDEAELVTPHGSQDASMPWAGDRSDEKDVTSAYHATEVIRVMSFNDSSERDVVVVDKRGWEEDEMHAALALCGLRG